MFIRTKSKIDEIRINLLVIQHRIPLPTAKKTPNVPPVCNIAFPKLLNSSRPRSPNLIPAYAPYNAPTLAPTVAPSKKPNFIRSKHRTPPPLCRTGIIAWLPRVICWKEREKRTKNMNHVHCGCG